jgi:hypothetical protein
MPHALFISPYCKQLPNNINTAKQSRKRENTPRPRFTPLSNNTNSLVLRPCKNHTNSLVLRPRQTTPILTFYALAKPHQFSRFTPLPNHTNYLVLRPRQTTPILLFYVLARPHQFSRFTPLPNYTNYLVLRPYQTTPILTFRPLPIRPNAPCWLLSVASNPFIAERNTVFHLRRFYRCRVFQDRYCVGVHQVLV